MTVTFVRRDVVETLHRMQIERFGGTFGLRDEGELESALARPLNKQSYGETDLVEHPAFKWNHLNRKDALDSIN